MKSVIVINSDEMGRGDKELGQLLIGSLLKKLWARQDRVDAIILYNSGVKLVDESSQLIDVLTGLYEQGVEIIACGTCIDQYRIEKEHIIGRVTDMIEILDIMMRTDKVITL